MERIINTSYLSGPAGHSEQCSRRCGLGRVLGTNVASVSPVTPKLAVGTEDGSSQPQPGPGLPGYEDDTGQLDAKIKHVASLGQKIKLKSRNLSTPLPFFS